MQTRTKKLIQLTIQADKNLSKNSERDIAWYCINKNTIIYATMI